MARGKKNTRKPNQKKLRKAAAAAAAASASAASPSLSAPADLEKVLSQADLAMETSNIEQAMKLYNFAANSLRKKVQQAASVTGSNNNRMERASDVLLFSKVLSKLGETKASMGDQDGGYKDFSDAINILSSQEPSIYPEEGAAGVANDEHVAKAQWKEARASLHLYLGQLSSEKEALESYIKAVTDLKTCISLLEQAVKSMEVDMSMTNSEEGDGLKHALVETRRQLCGAYCSIAELYLTDLCYEPNAESECEKSLKLALQLDEPSQNNTTTTSTPDAVQAMANLRLCQSRHAEAVPYILDAYSRMKVGCEAMANLVGLGHDEKKDDDMNDNNDEKAKEINDEALKAANTLPGFEFRCQTAKILLECAANLQSNEDAKQAGQKTYCIEAAIQTLGSLMAENDEVIETWYLLGCAFQAGSSPDYADAATHHFEKALEMLNKTKQGFEQQGSFMPQAGEDDMPSALEDVQQKIEDVKHKLNELTNKSDSTMDES